MGVIGSLAPYAWLRVIGSLAPYAWLVQGDAKHEVVVSDKWGDTKVPWNVLARTGDEFSAVNSDKKWKFGMQVDKDMNPIEVSHNPDFNSFLTAYNDKIYMVTHFEWPPPGVSYLSELTQKSDGKLEIAKTEPIDFSSVGGCWIPCAGSVSTWGSHLGSEEYEPNAIEFFEENDDDGKTVLATTQLKDHSYWSNQDAPAHMKYYGVAPENRLALTAKAAVEKGFNPYMSGYSWEVKVDSDGKPIVTKHFANGRMSYEMIYAMPDQKTIYGTDDGKDVMFSKFVTKKAGDMSEGELFCAKYTQNMPAAGGKADLFHATITWLSMGSAKDDDILNGDFSINKFNGTEKMTSFYGARPVLCPVCGRRVILSDGLMTVEQICGRLGKWPTTARAARRKASRSSSRAAWPPSASSSGRTSGTKTDRRPSQSWRRA